jgi:cleavage and polyadenylation specificity factor subunit 1
LWGPFRCQQATHTASLQSTVLPAGKKSSPSRTSQQTPWHTPYCAAGYPASVVRTTYQQTRNVNLKFNCSNLWSSIQLSQTTVHHPAANGLVERFRRTLKAAIVCHADQHWTEALLLVLLRIRTAFKEDLQASVAELVYGEPLRIPGELLAPTADPMNPAHLNTKLHQHMACLSPFLATCHASPARFVHSDLKKCTHVFFRQNTTCRPLEPPYSGPYQVLSWRKKTMQILVRDRPVTVSTNRVKPAYILNEIGCGTTTTTFNPSADAAPVAAPHAATPPPVARTTRSGRHVCFPARFNS